MKSVYLFLAVVVAVVDGGWSHAADRPNIVFIIADDLGYGDLGSYGQTKIKTPNLDRLAAVGMVFTTHYSGSNVCAPSRCVLMTGLHPGHAYIRDNRQAEGFDEGQEPVPTGSLRLPLIFKELGYTIGGFGKWGLGPVGSTGEPLRQGFDRWFGYNCQAKAHNYYPAHLWDNHEHVRLGNRAFAAHQKLPADAAAEDPESYISYSGTQYAPDLIAEQALDFVRANKDRPFFLYYATTVPHLALQVPADSLAEYAGQFLETPYPGGRGYLPHRQPRAAYAAMVTRMDRDIGRLLNLLKTLALEERTIVVFTSDNGPLYDGHGGTDTEFFNSAAGLRGRKGSFYEGGFRVPCVVRWPGRVEPGRTSHRVTGFEDWLPTLLELAGVADATPEDLDGISFAPTLLGRDQPPRPFLYRESPGYGGQQCIRVGDWKALRRNLNPHPRANRQRPGEIELYNLATDPGEQIDLSETHPDVAVKLQALMLGEHEKSTLFPIRALDDVQ
jgi:arylsulfatase A-like enzyme